MDNTQATQNLPEPGQLVMVRQRHFVVLDVQKSTLPADAVHSGGHSPQHVMSLSSVEDDALGEEIRVIWELEPGARAYERVSLPQPTDFDDPAQMDAFWMQCAGGPFPPPTTGRSKPLSAAASRSKNISSIPLSGRCECRG